MLFTNFQLFILQWFFSFNKFQITLGFHNFNSLSLILYSFSKYNSLFINILLFNWSGFFLVLRYLVYHLSQLRNLCVGILLRCAMRLLQRLYLFQIIGFQFVKLFIKLILRAECCLFHFLSLMLHRVFVFRNGFAIFAQLIVEL